MKMTPDHSKYYSYYGKDIWEAYPQEIRPYDVSDLIEMLDIRRDNPGISLTEHALRHAISEKERNKAYFFEALLTTYPTRKLVDTYLSWCRRLLTDEQQKLGFGAGPVIEKTTFYGWNKTGDIASIVVFRFPVFKDEEDNADILIRKFTDALYVCGYNLASAGLQDYGLSAEGRKVLICEMQFEATHQYNEFDFSPYLYHVAPFAKAKKIIRRGIIPHSRARHNYSGTMPELSFNDRVHLFNTENPEKMLKFAGIRDMSGLFAVFRMKTSDLFGRGLVKGDFFVDCVFEHGDWKTPDAIYTNSAIPPELIDNQIVVFEFAEGKPVRSQLMSKDDFILDENEQLGGEGMFHTMVINECDGGMGGAAPGGGISGGDMSPGVPSDPGGGITSDAVLGPSGGFEKGKGCLEPGDFHVPFPVMPMLRRWPCCNGGSLTKKKKGKKTVSVKNPYAKGMKTIVAEGENQSFEYTGEAKTQLDQITNGQPTVYNGVLYFNDRFRIAWRFAEDGMCKIYKPVQLNSGIWTIYATTLGADGNVYFDYKAGKYQDERSALDAIYKAAEDHKKKLNEALGTSGERSFVFGLDYDQAVKILKDAEPLIDNDLYKFEQFDKFKTDSTAEYVGLFGTNRKCLAMAVVKHDYPFQGYTYVNELQRLVGKGTGEQLLKTMEDHYGKLWLMCDYNGGEKLLGFYRKPVFGLDEYNVENSVYGCPVSFFYTKGCDEGRLLGYIDAFYDNGSKLDNEELEEVEETDDLIVDYLNAVADED